MAVSRKRNNEFYIRWCQNSRLVQGFHPLFHESDVTPLFHPLSASFLKETTLSGCSTVQNFSENGQNMPPGTTFHVGKKKLQFRQKRARNCTFCELFHFGSFTVNCGGGQITIFSSDPFNSSAMLFVRIYCCTFVLLQFCTFAQFHHDSGHKLVNSGWLPGQEI